MLDVFLLFGLEGKKSSAESVSWAHTLEHLRPNYVYREKDTITNVWVISNSTVMCINFTHNTNRERDRDSRRECGPDSDYCTARVL